MKIPRPVILFALILIMGGCNQSQDGSKQQPPEPTADPVEISAPGTDKTGESMNDGMQEKLEAATRDLAARLGISSDEISVVRADHVTWRDGSLGCPRKDMMYTQALVPGTLIILAADGREFEYHSGRSGAPAFCASPQPPLEVSGSANH